MHSKQFALGTFSYAVVGIAWVLPVWFIISLIWNASGELNLERDWFRFLVIFVIILSPSLITTWSFIVEMTTVYSTSGVSRITILGRRFIKWHNVASIDKGLFALVLRLHKKNYYIRLLMYKDPKAVIDFVENQYTSSIKKLFTSTASRINL